MTHNNALSEHDSNAAGSGRRAGASGRRWRLAAPVLAATSALALATVGLGGVASATAHRGKRAVQHVTLSFEYQQPTPGAPNYYLQDVKAFEKLHPGVTVSVSDNLPSNDYLAKLSSQMGAGTANDVFIGWTYARLRPYALGGRLLNLSPYLAKDPSIRNKISSFALQAATVKNKVYAIPLTNDAEVIFYNKKVFAKTHIGVPKTYAQFVADVKKLRKGGFTPIALGNSSSFNGSILYTMLAERLGGYPLYQKAVVEQKAKFDNPAFVKAGKYLQNLVKMGAFNSNYASESIGYAASLLTSNKAGMFINGTWETYALNQGLGKDLGWFTLPPIAGGKDNSPVQMIELPNNAASVSASSAHKALAVKFLEYLVSYPAQVVEAKAGNSLATSYKLPASVTNPTSASIHAVINKTPRAMAPWDTLLGVAVGEQFDNDTQLLYAGNPPASVLSQFDSQEAATKAAG